MNDDYLTHEGGKFDFIGFDDGTRNLPLSNPFLELTFLMVYKFIHRVIQIMKL